MKKSLISLAGILAILLCVLVYHFSLSPEAQKEAPEDPGKSYVDQSLPLLLADLSTDNFLRYAAKSLIDSTSRQDLDLMFDWFSRLGSLESYSGAQGEVHTTIFNDKSEEFTGEYTAQVLFESGPAGVNVTIIKENGAWKINSIRIDSKALMQNEGYSHNGLESKKLKPWGSAGAPLIGEVRGAKCGVRSRQGNKFPCDSLFVKAK